MDITITHAQLDDLNNNPVVLAVAPGVGRFNEPRRLRAVGDTIGGAYGFDNDGLAVQYEGETEDLALLSATGLLDAGAKVAQVGVLDDRPRRLHENKALVLKGYWSALTGGHADNTLTLHIEYDVVEL